MVDLRARAKSATSKRTKGRNTNFDEKLDVTFRILPRHGSIRSLHQITLDDLAALPELGITSRNFPSKSNVDVLACRKSERLLGMLEFEAVESRVVVDDVDLSESSGFPFRFREEL